MNNIPNAVPPVDCTLSPKKNMPQLNETNTVMELHVPTLIAKPAFLIPNIPHTPPDTHIKPDAIPHGVNLKSTPSSRTIQLVRKHMADL
jgi:hypothetical protein